MQCKDIPDRPILKFLAAFDLPYVGAFLYDCGVPGASILEAVPHGVPEKLVRAKMAQMIRRGVVEGCTCGCRGDFRITEKGIAELKRGM